MEGFGVAEIARLRCSSPEVSSTLPAYYLCYGYPPDLQEQAVKTVLAQAELLCAEWV